MSATVKMKALVASRLLMGDLNDWAAFQRERDVANRIVNRRLARSVSVQIGRGYQELSGEIKKFIGNNFQKCSFADLAKLCDEIVVGEGLYLRIEDFESRFFPVAESVKQRVPGHAHIAISTFGMQFEYPEHHFLNDLDTGLLELRDIASRLSELNVSDSNQKAIRDKVRPLVSRDKFVSRSIVSAAYSLVEAFISGCLYTADSAGHVGRLVCDDSFRAYARAKNSEPFKNRVERLVAFASSGTSSAQEEPFKEFIDSAKRIRDAIHHTTPFERKAHGIAPGQRLTDLYRVNSETAIRVVLLALGTVSAVVNWTQREGVRTELSDRCEALLISYLGFCRERGFGLR